MKKSKKYIRQFDVVGYIYLIKSPLGYKIGKTKDINDRAAIFNVKLPFEWSFEKIFLVPHYHFLEKYLHNLFDNKKINGEWFNLEEKEIESLINACDSWKIVCNQNLEMLKNKTFDISGPDCAIVIWPDVSGEFKEYCIKLCNDGSLEIFSSYVDNELIVDIEKHIIRVYHKQDVDKFNIDAVYSRFLKIKEEVEQRNNFAG